MHVRTIQTLEIIMKGAANKKRIAIISLLARQNDLDVELIAEKLNISYTSAAAHLQKMHAADIVSKEDDGYFVLHRLTTRGRQLNSLFRRLC
ncbi:winged helix-turn-helix transcriptional regulator [Candidatus Kaiserbacteria bacterium]|nr:MAG: winged helix-turn-helix transcriptional regulator [Candidatus Kaiserbacteria bacterium]